MNIQSGTITHPLLLDRKGVTVYYEIDRFINEVLVQGEYLKPLLSFDILKRSDLKVIDLGCNIGAFSLSIYDCCSSIHAIDLSTACIDILRKTIDYNALNKINTYNCAIGNENTTVYPSSLEVTDGGNTISGGTEPLESYTLSTFCKNNNIDNIDLLKIDIEGAENLVFSSDDFHIIAPHINYIVGEVHSDQSAGNYLMKHNFTVNYKGNIIYAKNNNYAYSIAPDQEL